MLHEKELLILKHVIYELEEMYILFLHVAAELELQRPY